MPCRHAPKITSIGIHAEGRYEQALTVSSDLVNNPEVAELRYYWQIAHLIFETSVYITLDAKAEADGARML